MIRIYPNIEFSVKCPIDEAELTLKGVVIPGMRCLADAYCPVCQEGYYVDLPIGEALWNPIILNKRTAEIFDPFNIYWFSSLLKEGFLNPVKTGVYPLVHEFFKTDRIVILNCIDFLYGHCLLKLLNAERYLKYNPDLGLIVLVPTQLRHLVPDGVAEIWEFPVSIKHGWKWYSSMNDWINKELAKRGEAFLSHAYSHPSNLVYDLNSFVHNLPDISDEISGHEPVVLFSLREDRLWGGKPRHQRKNLQGLYNLLSATFPNLAFVLIGIGRHTRLRATGARLIDLRADAFDLETDRRWMAYMSRADCVVGVHGSNMLLPSGLAQSTVELLPLPRLSNSVQDFLFPASKTKSRDVLLNYRMLYGNEDLSDISPSDVTDLVVNSLSYDRMESIMFGSGEDEALKDYRIIREKLLAIRQGDIFKQACRYFKKRTNT